MPPQAVMRTVLSASLARLRSVAHACSCTAAEIGCVCMAVTMVGPPPSTSSHWRFPLFRARFLSAPHAACCTVGEAECVRMAVRMDWTTAEGTDTAWPPEPVARFCSAAQANSWTVAEAGCRCMAVTTALRAAGVGVWGVSGMAAARLQSAAQPAAWTGEVGWAAMADRTAGTPPREAMVARAVGSRGEHGYGATRLLLQESGGGVAAHGREDGLHAGELEVGRGGETVESGGTWRLLERDGQWAAVRLRREEAETWWHEEAVHGS